MKWLYSLAGAFLCLSFAQTIWDTPQGRERIFEATVQLFSTSYWDVDYIDWEQWAGQFRNEALAAETREDFDYAMRTMISQLNDQHSKWLGRLPTTTPVVLEPSLGIEHSYLPGTGVVIENVLPQSPAEDKLERGDIIVRLNGQDLRNRNSYTIAQYLGETLNQSEVILEIRRKQQRLNVRLNPQELDLSRLKNLPQSELLSQDIGYIYLPSFTQRDTAKEFHQHLKKLQTQGVTQLILDLRDNPGGGLGELGLVICAFVEGHWLRAIQNNQIAWTAACDYHNDKITNTLTSSKGETLSQDSLSDATFFSGPIVVLVSRYNNSAGEVAALVLQEMLGSTIIGEKTSGNVEALQEFTLSDQSVVLVAVANLQGVKGTNFSLGASPDIFSQRRLAELARGFDAPVAEAIKVLESLPFTPGKYF